jgi:hypothetical protein
MDILFLPPTFTPRRSDMYFVTPLSPQVLIVDNYYTADKPENQKTMPHHHKFRKFQP